MPTITPTQAQTELDRRALPRKVNGKPNPARAKGRPQAEADGTFDLKTEALVSLAQALPAATAKAAAKAKAVKPAKPARVVDPHTALRKQAWDWKVAEFKAGRKVTTDEAYAKFGTHRARPVAPKA